MASPPKGVKFGAEIIIATGEGGDNTESDGDYCGIFTSEAESFSTSDEEDAELLQIALEGAYICSPFKRSTIIDPAKRSLYLLFDKDLMGEDECKNDEPGN